MASDAAIDKAGAEVPRHVAIIMDGNGRWARQRALPRVAGHKFGIKPVRRCVEYCAEIGVENLTLFAFSSENFKRPAEEVSGLMSLFLDTLEREVAELDRNGIRLKFIGNRARLSPALQQATRAAERKTAANTRMQLVVAVAYGGRWDIVEAARQLAERAARGELDPAAIDEACVASGLQTAGLPNLDLLIRTGGEQRVSNFLLWDLAYSEVYFSDLLWPDFDRRELDRIFDFFARRQRRFGRVEAETGAVTC